MRVNSFGMLNDYRDEGGNCGNLLEENTFLEERSKIRKGRDEREEKSNVKGEILIQEVQEKSDKSGKN